MKDQFTAKYWQLIINKNQTSGFTLSELLVTIMIIGILSAIGINSLLNHAPKAKQSEAKTTIASINTAQHTYRIENPRFANNMNELSLSLPTITKNYTYIIVGDATIGTVNATISDTNLKGYAGAVQKYNNSNNEREIASVICEAITPGNNIAAIPTSGKPNTGACGTDKELGQ